MATTKSVTLVPAEVGLKATLMVQVPPMGVTLVEQVSSVMTNSALESVTVKGAKGSGPEQLAERPDTFTVNVTAGPVVPTATEPRSDDDEVEIQNGAGPPRLKDSSATPWLTPGESLSSSFPDARPSAVLVKTTAMVHDAPGAMRSHPVGVAVKDPGPLALTFTSTEAAESPAFMT